MSELVGSSENQYLSDEGLSAGALLQKAREQHKLSIEHLAQQLKVAPQKLAALESDRLEALSNPVFIRALAGSACRILKIDPGPVLAKLPSAPRTSIRTDDKGLNTRFSESGTSWGRGWFAHDRKTIALAALLLLVSALGIFLWPSESADESRPLAAPAPAPTVVESPALALPVQNPASSNAATAAPAPAQIPEPVEQTLAEDVARSSELTFRASGSSWVLVKDAKGVVQLHKTMHQGEELSVTGELPLSVVIGRANVLAVSFRNQSINLSDVTKNSVARFEVK